MRYVATIPAGIARLTGAVAIAGVLATLAPVAAHAGSGAGDRLEVLVTNAGFNFSKNDDTVTVNGHTFRAVTSAPTFRIDIDSTTASYTDTFYVDGVVFASGTDIADGDFQRILDALGAVAAQTRTSTEVLRSEAQQVTGVVARRISQILTIRPPAAGGRAKVKLKQTSGVGNGAVIDGNGIRGISSGDSGDRIGLWASATYGWLNNSFVTTKYDGDLKAGVAGLDYQTGNLVVGAALTVDATDLNTTFNGGTFRKQGVSVTPYAAYSMMDGRLVLDALAGYGMSENRPTHSSGATRVTGRYDSERIMLGTHATYTENLGDWNVGAKVGYLWSRETGDGYTQSDNIVVASSATKLGEVGVGPRVGYSMGGFEPYAAATYLYDVSMTKTSVAGAGIAAPPNDRDEVEGIIGLNWFPADNVTSGFEIAHSFFREKASNTSLTVNGRITF